MATNDIVAPPYVLNRTTDPRLNNSSFSRFCNRVTTKIHDGLFVYNTTANDYSEKASDNAREFIRPHHQSGLAYRCYGLADGLNLSVSLCSLWYTLRHAYQQSSQLLSPNEFQLSLKEFHEAEKTPEGLSLAILFTVFLVGFSVLGSFYDEKKDHPWIKQLVFYWPYVRDAAKQYKWTSKGAWAALSLLLQYGAAQQNYLIQLLFPIMLIGATLSAINRIWLRWMRDNRKDMVRMNLDLIEGAKASLHVLDKLPKSCIGFECSLICLPSSNEIYYINEYGEAELVEMDESGRAHFYQQVAELQTTNVHARMKQYLHYLRQEEQHAAEQKKPLHFVLDQNEMGVIPTEPNILQTKDKRFFDSYVYLSQETGIDDAQRLYYVTATGCLMAQEHSSAFHKKYMEVQQDKNILNLSTAQLKTVGQPIITNRRLGQTYQEFTTRRQDILAQHSTDLSKNIIKQQSTKANWFALFSAGASSIGDGLYYYMFVAKMTLAVLSPPMAFYMLSASVGLFAICMITRIAEEYDFQRRLDITVLRTEVELSKKDCVMLHEQLEILLDKEKGSIEERELEAIIAALQRSRAHRAEQLRIHGVTTTPDPTIQPDATKGLSQHSIATMLFWNELHDELKLGNVLQKKLRVKLDRTYWQAGLEGIQNGLAIQGAISSFSFMVASLCFVSSAACPPVFIMGCLTLGIAAIILSCLQGIISHYFYLEKVKKTQLELESEFQGIVLEKMQIDTLSTASERRDSVDKAMASFSHQPIDAPAYFVVVEWSEIFRLFFKGLKKGHDAGIEYCGRLLADTDYEWWMLPMIIISASLGFAGALSMRATAKGFAVGRPESHNGSSGLTHPTNRFFDRGRQTANQHHDEVFSTQNSLQISGMPS